MVYFKKSHLVCPSVTKTVHLLKAFCDPRRLIKIRDGHDAGLAWDAHRIIRRGKSGLQIRLLFNICVVNHKP